MDVGLKLPDGAYDGVHQTTATVTPGSTTYPTKPSNATIVFEVTRTEESVTCTTLITLDFEKSV